MYTVLKIMGLLHELLNLMGEISALKISLSKLEAGIELSRHLANCHKSKLSLEADLAEIQTLKGQIEEKQATLNGKGSEAAMLQRELRQQHG